VTYRAAWGRRTSKERKEFVRTFIGSTTVRPDTGVLDVQMRNLPELGKGNSTCEMVAGARYEPVQIEMRPLCSAPANLLGHESRVKTDVWWRRRESNPRPCS